MARERKGLTGDKGKELPSILEDYFEELSVDPISSPVDSSINTDSPEDPPLEQKEKDVSDILDSLPTTKELKEEPSSPPSIRTKGGKLKIKTEVKEIKYTKSDFLELSKNGKYNLKTKDEHNSKQLATIQKTVSIRPDLLAIYSEVASGVYGLQTKLINNALITELIRLGVLDESSAEEIQDY